MLRRMRCWLGFHSAPEGMGATDAVYWACSGCGQLLPGERAKGRRR